jgi:hypothetical protein
MPRCNLCNNFERKPRDYRVAFDFSPQELEDSVAAGCLVCSLLHDGAAHFSSKIGGLSRELRIHVWGGNIEGGGNVEMEIYCSGALKLALEFFFASNSESPIRGMKTLPTISGNTASEESMAWVRRLLDNCIKSHSSCSQQHVPNLPTRVLEIGSDDTKPTFRLLCSPSTKARYACLSHCWGNSRAIVTEKATLETYTQGISWDMLPETFQEAVLIARKLGLQYLWVDSLCIIQDDIQDWRKESAQMASIYQNSCITIAATKSPNDSGGCFSTKSPYHSDYQLSLRGRQSDIYVREKILHFGDPHCSSPLLKRAWVYQERLLAPRMLHFCEKEIVWECQQLTRCECSCFKPAVHLKEEFALLLSRYGSEKPSAQVIHEDTRTALLPTEVAGDLIRPDEPYLPGIIMTTTLEEKAPRKHRHKIVNMAGRFLGGHSVSSPVIPSAERRPNSREESPGRPDRPSATLVIGPAISIWRKIVSEYSALHMTKESDRLPAIAGVARQVGTCLTGRYLAGLWECALPNDLLWRVDDIQSQQRPKHYRAPSWSWASANGKVIYPQEDPGGPHDKDFKVLSVSCTPVSDVDPFGEVGSGFLQVLAHVTPAKILHDECINRAAPSRFAKVQVAGEIAILTADFDIQAQDLERIYSLGNFATNEYIISLLVQYMEGEDTYQRIGTLRRNHPDFSSKVHATFSIKEADAFGIVDRRVRIVIV